MSAEKGRLFERLQQREARVELHPATPVETVECRIHGVPLVEVYRAAVSMSIVCPGESVETVVDRVVEIARRLEPEPVVHVTSEMAKSYVDGLPETGGSHV